MKGKSAILILTLGTDTMKWTYAAVRYAVKHVKIPIFFNGGLISVLDSLEDGMVESCDAPADVETLYVITTGGDIEFSPLQNKLATCLMSMYNNPNLKIVFVSACTMNSSDLTFEKIKAIIKALKTCFDQIEMKQQYEIDMNFDENVYVIYTDPFKTEERYRKEMEGASAIIIVGYGAGNINIESDSGFSLIQLIKEKSKDIPIVLTGQNTSEPSDFICENAWEAIKAGAISGVDLTIPEIQMRLSYLMGHRYQIDELCNGEDAIYNFLEVVEWLFLSGREFSSQHSRRVYENLRRVHFPKEDRIINCDLDKSLCLFSLENGMLKMVTNDKGEEDFIWVHNSYESD